MFRKVEVYKESEWVETPFTSLNKGDIFRMFEFNGELVKDMCTGSTNYEAISEVYYDDEGIPKINVKDYREDI